MTSIAQVVPFDSGPTRAEALRRVAVAVRSSAEALQAAAEALVVIADEPEPPTVPAQDDMLTVAEAARELRRSPAFVRAQCRRGSLKALKDAHGYRIRRSHLQTYERRRTA